MAFNKIKITIAAGLLLFSTGTICSAKPLIKKDLAPAAVTGVGTPELAAADQRVVQTQAQLETAKRQLDATRVLVKAAEADFRAAKAEREALALKTQAQSLADASGLQPAKARKAELSSSNANVGNNNQRLDFNAEPASTPAANVSEPMQLR